MLDQVVAGRSNKAIATALAISEQSVKAHISRLFLKFDVVSRATLMAAVLNGDIDAQAEQITRFAQLLEDERRSALRARAKFVATLVSPEPAAIVDPDGRLLIANPSFERVFAAAVYQDERGMSLPKSATPVIRAARGERRSHRFRLASGPRKGSWWEARAEPVQLNGAGRGALITFHRVRAPGA